MAEYAGFQEREGVDWAKSIGGLSETVSGLEKKVKDVRESDKKLMTDNDALLESHKPFNFTGANDFNSKAVVNIRQKMYELNKQLNSREISPSEYRTSMQNIKTDWSNHINLMKTYDDRMLEAKQRLEPGPNGELPKAAATETYLYNQLNNFWTELSKKQMFVGPNGKLATAQTDADGNIIKGSIYDLASQVNVNNIATDRLLLRDNIKKDVEALGDYSIFTINPDGSTKDISAIEADPEFQNYKTQIVGKYVNNNSPKVIASILLDNSNSGYIPYTSEDEKKQIIKDKIEVARLAGQTVDESKIAKDIESKMIKLEQSENGVWNPIITKEHREAAAKVVSTELMSQLGYDEKGTGRKVQSGGGNRGLTAKQELDESQRQDRNYDVYKGASDAFAKNDFAAYDTDKYLFKRAFNNQGKPYVLVYERSKGSNGIDTTEELIKEGLKKPKTTLRSPEQGAAYLRLDSGTTPYGAKDYFEGKELFYNKHGEYNFDNTKPYGPVKESKNAKVPAKKTKYTAAQEANIKATMKANPGATREQAAKALGY